MPASKLTQLASSDTASPAAQSPDGRQPAATPSASAAGRWGRVGKLRLPVALLLAAGCSNGVDHVFVEGAPVDTEVDPTRDPSGSGHTETSPAPASEDGSITPQPEPAASGDMSEPLSSPDVADSGVRADDDQGPGSGGLDECRPDEGPSLDAGAPPDKGPPSDETPPPGDDPPADDPPGDEPSTWLSGLDERPPAPELALPATLQLAAPGWVPVIQFPALTFDFPTVLQEAPGTGKIFVAEINGRIYAFDNDPAVTEKSLVLDISDHCQGVDTGILGMTFHPEFNQPSSPNRGYIYVQYPFKADPISDRHPPGDTQTRMRLARFTVDLATLRADPASELILMDQEDEALDHQGGSLFFHPDDGFLYYAVGDEGRRDCILENCQIIDKDLYSGILRIDVDMRGGNISHPIPRQPATGTTANYYIPNDNPFVGRPGVLEEFYALGLRSPHRMTYDRIDDMVWIGEVGQKRLEELNVLRKGANFQWAALEGPLPVFDAMPAEPLGIWTDPVLTLGRDEGSTIIGGYVYRGSKNPSLYGKYIFADFTTGNIWALRYSYDGTRATVLERELLLASEFRVRSGIVSFGVDRHDELYMLPWGRGQKIYSLGRTEGFTNAPARLSQTGVFVDTASRELEVSPGLIPYDVQSPLWSDGAEKRRWASIPDGETVAFSARGRWSFPEGSVFVKHFELALDEAHPEAKRRLETRLLVRGDNSQFYGLTYKWNPAGTDADLLFERQVEPIDVALADGQTRHLKYLYPGPRDCGVCHTEDVGPVLGVRTSQLNHDMLYPESGRASNQLYTWAQSGLIDVALGQTAVESLESLSALDDVAAPVADRIRSYWASNCSMCHRGEDTASGIEASWDARYETRLEDQGVIYGLAENGLSADVYLVAPGDAVRSRLFQRSNSAVAGVAMPPIGRSAVDPHYVQLLEQWIMSLSANEGP